MTDNSFDHGNNLLASIMGANEFKDNNNAPIIDNNNEDESELLDEEPFDIDHYKLPQEPGMSYCRGRNILTILEDRSMRGAGYVPHRYCRAAMLSRSSSSSQSQQDDMKIGEESRDTSQDGSASSNNSAKMMVDDDNDDDDIPTTPEQNHSGNPFGSPSYHSPTPGMTTPILPPRDQTPNNNDRQQIAAINNTNNQLSTSSSTPTDPSNITTELTSFVEYAAATKFRGSYLQHLRGDAPVRPPPPPRYPTLGMMMSMRNATSSVNSNNNLNNSNSSSIMSASWASMTREQRETQRQLQQHLQQHNAANRMRASSSSSQNNNNNQQQELSRRGMNPVRQLPTGNNNNQNEAVPANPIPNNFPSRRGVAARRPPNRQNNNNNNNPSNNNNNRSTTNAVSTISIDFSPNGRTLASTHGDHTVKITCAHTGKLLRQLEGHPRTPWTVKYHPTNYRLVASGCLGCQVRVWDWNFQTERVRRERREGLERRWGGRYHFGNGGRDEREVAWNTARGGFTSSPRAVVDQYWKGGGTEVDRMDCRNTTAALNSSSSSSSGVGSWEMQYRQQTNATAASAGVTTSTDGVMEDDYATYALATMGIPLDDPAWYDTESEVYNYEKGIGVCLQMIRLNHAIISLSFHPSGEVLAIASGSTLHLWDYDEEKRKKKDALLKQQQQRQTTIDGNNHTSQLSPQSLATIKVRETDDRILNRHQNQSFPHGRTMDFAHDSALRCVHFPPGGDTIIIGGVNPQSYNEGLPGRRDRGGMQGGGMSFHLRLWDFSLDAVLNPCTEHRPTASASGRGSSALGGRITDEGDLTWNFYVTKETLANPRVIIPRVLLYNDGGFDISKDGTVLSACAEYWLPDGVNSANELIQSLREIEEKAEKTDDDDLNNNSDDLSRSPPRYLSPSRPNMSSFPDPRTPPPNNSYAPLEPPSPPGKRNVLHIKRGVPIHTPHPLSMVAASHPLFQGGGGRYVPHIVTVSLDSSPPPDGELMQLDPKILRTESMRKYPKLGQLLMAAPLDGAKASGVTCVKLSPSAEYCLLGYGVRENIPSVDGLDENRHPVTALYNVKKGMKHVSTLTSADDDVNIARFHPESGHGFVYGTKQGRVRVLAPRVWNHYHVDDDE